MNYSKLVFEEDHVKLVSTKNKNFEVVPYKIITNTIKHESIVRFIDLEKQLKAVTDTTLDISYGETQAIVINSGNSFIKHISFEDNIYVPCSSCSTGIILPGLFFSSKYKLLFLKYTSCYIKSLK